MSPNNSLPHVSSLCYTRKRGAVAIGAPRTRSIQNRRDTMTTILPLLEQPAIEALGWALLHFLWQGAAVGLVLAAVLAAMRRWSSAARYSVCCAALAAMAVLPIATAICCRPAPMTNSPLASTAAPVEAGSVPARDQERGSSAGIQVSSPEATGEMPFDRPRRKAHRAAGANRTCPAVATTNLVRRCGLRALLPGCVAAWLCGVLVLSLRLLANWRRVQRMRRTGIEPVSHDVATVFDRLVCQAAYCTRRCGCCNRRWSKFPR